MGGYVLYIYDISIKIHKLVPCFLQSTESSLVILSLLLQCSYIKLYVQQGIVFNSVGWSKSFFSCSNN